MRIITISDFMQAVIEDDITNVKQGIKAGIDLDCFEDVAKLRPLHYAAQYNLVRMAKLLLANGANSRAQDEDGNTPLDIAKLHNANEVIDLLITLIKKPMKKATQ